MTLSTASCWEMSDDETRSNAFFNPKPGSRLFRINAEIEYTWLADEDKDDGEEEEIVFDDADDPFVVRQLNLGFYLERSPLMEKTSSSTSILKQFLLSYVALPKEDHMLVVREILSVIGSVNKEDDREIIPLGLEVQCYLDSRRKVDEVKNAATRAFHSRGLKHVRVWKRGDCSICLQTMKSGSVCVETSCAHVFHGDCISSWLANTATCPMCRCTTVSTVWDDTNFMVCIA